MKKLPLKLLLQEIRIYLNESSHREKKLQTELDELLDENELKKASKEASKIPKVPSKKSSPKFKGTI